MDTKRTPLLDDSAMRIAADRIRQGVDAETVYKMIRDTYEERMAELEQASQGSVQPLDMPDGPGWWGYTGKQQGVVWFTEFTVSNDTVAIRWGDDDYPITYDLAWFRNFYRNLKFYRLTMPWEQRPAAPTGQGVSE